MAFNDLRGYIAKLEETGDVVKVEKEVDWNLEASAITRRCSEIDAPAQFFQKIKDYPENYRVFGDPHGTLRRLAIAMEMAPDSSYGEILEEYGNRVKNPIKPIVVENGPCKENVHTGEEVNLYEFPALMQHMGDAGRYISTWHLVALKDPDSGWVNWGMYRQMIHDKKTLGGVISSFHHGGVILRKYEERNKKLEFAIVLGTEPMSTIVAAASPPYGVNEVDVAGGLRKEPVSLVKCETVDLMVPATSEIVFEGEILPHERKEEGPFGEYPGYQLSERAPRPVYHVKAITHRNDPILPVTCMGIPVESGHVVFSIAFAHSTLEELKRQGLPVTGIYYVCESALFLMVVSTKTPYADIATRIAHCIWGTELGQWSVKVVVVDDDVDPSNLKEVLHAFATKCHPIRGTLVAPNAPGNIVTPYMSPEERALGKTCLVAYDCTWPKEWDVVPTRSSFKDIYPKELQAKVLESWKEYGF